MRSAPSLTLDWRVSPIARLALTTVAGLAVVAVVNCALPASAQALLILTVLAATGSGWRVLARPQVTRATLQSDGLWLLATPNGEHVGRLESAAALGNLISLTWRGESDHRRRTLVLWPDAVPSPARRALRVWLRSGRALAGDRDGVAASSRPA